MALKHAQPGTIIDVQPLGATLRDQKTQTLAKTDETEIIRLVLPAGREIATHTAPGPITIHCIERQIAFSTMGNELEMHPGQLLYLNANEPHSVRAVEDSSLLLTILLSQK
ncbi:MAG: cupin domain-containing protein [Planctomycetaceae bacterium]|nr:cupin domain-containing protein [Planctomycetaceae bacterium]